MVPPEYAHDRAAYVDLVCGEMLAACAPLARWIDVFCDRGAFDAEETRAVLRAGVAAGLEPRLHGNQLAHGPGAQIAAEFGAASVDHCTYLTDDDVAALAQAGVVATLLPGAEFSTRSPYPDARRLLDAGVTVALATDCNPGSSFVTSMPFVIALAVREMRMTPAEALWAATAGGAAALRRDDIGRLARAARRTSPCSMRRITVAPRLPARFVPGLRNVGRWRTDCLSVTGITPIHGPAASCRYHVQNPSRHQTAECPMQRRFAFLISVACALAVLMPASAFAWGSGNVDSLDDTYWGTHDWVVWQAYVQAGKPSWFKINEALLNNDDPDDVDPDRFDHVFHVEEQFGGAAWRVGELYIEAVKAHDRGDYVAASRAIGLLSHYYSDVTVPFHTYRRDEGTVYDTLHDPYEKAAREYSHDKADKRMLSTRSRKTATNVRTMTRSAAAAANTKLSTIVAGKGSFANAAVRDATRYCLSRAVNDLADMMKSVPSGAGRPSAATAIPSFKPYRRYTGKGKWARADARIVNSNGNPLRAMKVEFTWQFDGSTRKIARYTDSDGWAYCWTITPTDQPYFKQFTASARVDSGGKTYRTPTTWFVTTPILEDGA